LEKFFLSIRKNENLLGWQQDKKVGLGKGHNLDQLKDGLDTPLFLT
jgi:hypothetical protein